MPPEVGAVLKRMLAKTPDARFQTPAAVALALASFPCDDPSGRAGLCRKMPTFTMAAAQCGKDHTPLPSALTNFVPQIRNFVRDFGSRFFTAGRCD